jgi:benzoyl-CoA reductase subunit B
MSRPVPTRLASTLAANAHQKEEFQAFRRRVLEDGEPYVISDAVAPAEILHAMDIHVTPVVWYSAIIAAKQLSPYYFEQMDARGFHDRLPRYTSLPLMSTLDGDPQRAPYGGLPKPMMILSRFRDDYGQRISELWSRAYGGVPVFSLDASSSTALGPRWWERGLRDWETLYEPHRLDFQVEQLEGLIRTAETLSGRSFAPVEFMRQMHRINEAGEIVADIRDMLARARPLPVPLTEQLANVMAPTWDRGSAWSVAHLKAFREELRTLIGQGAAACPNERLRLLWVGNGLWFNTGFYRAFEEKYGAVFVWSMYSNFLSDGYRRYFRDDPAHALRALASRHISMNEQLHVPPWMGDWIVEQARAYGADGAVMLVPKHDRMGSLGSRLTKVALERAGIPVVELHANMVDARMWDDAAMRRTVEDFIEQRLLRGSTTMETA